MKKRLVTVIVFVGTLLLLPSIASACGCSPICDLTKTNRECVESRLNQGKGAFLGKVVALSPGSWAKSASAKFEVLKSWKYRAKRLISIQYSGDDGANCGINLEVGKEYLVYLNVSDSIRDSLSVCDTGSTDDQKLLGKANIPKRRKVSGK